MITSSLNSIQLSVHTQSTKCFVCLLPFRTVHKDIRNRSLITSSGDNQQTSTQCVSQLIRIISRYEDTPLHRSATACSAPLLTSVRSTHKARNRVSNG